MPYLDIRDICGNSSLTSLETFSASVDYFDFLDFDNWDEEIEYNKETQEEWPEGFLYECCQRHLKQEPCVKDWHQDVTPSSKKRKI